MKKIPDSNHLCTTSVPPLFFRLYTAKEKSLKPLRFQGFLLVREAGLEPARPE